ncbi:MAG: RNA polymerase sigma-70 factor [Bacteroidota bacterium]
MFVPEENIADKIRAGDKSAFEYAFKKFYNPLFNLAKGLLHDDHLAEEQVQEVFIKLWEKKDDLKSGSALLPFLMVTTRNRCFNCIRNQKVVQKYVTEKQKHYQDQVLNEDLSEVTEELIERMYEAVQTLPEKCKEVFQLSRFKGLSHKQIAEKLSISTKTIENHITKAMRILRKELNEKKDKLLFLIYVGELLINGVII